MAGYPAYNYPNFQPSYNQPQIPMNYFTPNMQQQINQMQQQAQPALNGKLVENIDNVKLTDIPMDGNSYYFPKADGTEIYTKRWLANGSTEIAIYKRIIDETDQVDQRFDFNEMENNIMEKLNSIDERFVKFEKSFNSKATVKKEA